MEEIDRFAGGFTEDDDEEEAQRRTDVFAQLKPYCLELLELVQNPKKQSSTIPAMLELLRKSPPTALQPFFDYTLFPLLLLFDAAVDCRSPPKVEMLNVPNAPHKMSDNVAEGVLQCLAELLKKSYFRSVDQMVVVLKKLTYGALLSPSEASEEFREGVIKCFKALLLSLLPCSDESCPCKQNFDLPILLESSDLQAPFTRSSKYDKEPEECLLAFLQSQTASAAVGHWLSLLLKAADTEAARGHRGSANLRVEAFITLRLLIAKVGTADALAFFLPGVVSQFAKVLHVSKTIISGAAGSADAIDQAIRGLAEYLIIVLQDDANLSGLDMSVDVSASFNLNEHESVHSLLEELRHLPIKAQGQSKSKTEDSRNEVENTVSPNSALEKKGTDSGKGIGSFLVNRTKEWIEKTSAHVNKLLSSNFPHICVHPAKKVRQGIVAAIQGLLSKCSHTLKDSRLMLLECICVLVVDDSEEVSAAAQVSLEFFFSTSGKHVERDVTEIFGRLIEKLPKAVLGSEESLALTIAQQLLVIIYYSGPQLVMDHLLQSSVTAARFMDIFALCLSHNSVFSGSLDKLILARPSSTGYLHSVTELERGKHFTSDSQAIINATLSGTSKFTCSQEREIGYMLESVQKNYELPCMPPWFVYVGSRKLYEALAGIIRLVGLSLMADARSEGHLSVITDIPLQNLRKLVSDVRMKEYSQESWQSWYNRNGSGQLLRQASTAAFILNEMIFGLSDQSIDIFTRKFHKSRINREESRKYVTGCSDQSDSPLTLLKDSVWKVSQGPGARTHLIDCVGRILHEYLSSEVWDLPIEHKSSFIQPESEVEDISLHFFHDTAMLHKVVIDGIGIFNMCLGKDFSASGFLHSSLYMLLENLICSNFQIRSAADAVLHVLASKSGYPSVGHLVMANADYVVDSICRQLRHLDLNPQVPNVLAAMLSYIGVAHKILPLLEEPMRSVSLELEILGRHQHPDLTISFLKAVAEIAKASKQEACLLPTLAESFFKHVKSKISDEEKKERMEFGQTGRSFYDDDTEQWESILFKLNDSKRYRRTVGSIAGSCLTAATPLLASVKQSSCLVALDIVEHGIATLAKVEEAYKHEKETKETIEEVIRSHSFYQFQDTLDAADEGTDENRLLPAMNKIWPFLVVCVRSSNPVAVRSCLSVVSNVVQICGGDFFSRRFHTDGPQFWKLLTTSPFQRKLNSKEHGTQLRLPYRGSSISSEDSVAEVTNLKVQVVVLNMIADLSRNKRSASALEVVFKKVSGIVVGIACSSVVGLRDAAVDALQGLASNDPDLIWLLLTDVYYSLKKKDLPSPPIPELPQFSQILPPPLSPKGYLYVQYGGQSSGFDIDFSAVETVFKKLHLQVFTTQMYS